MDLDLDYNTGGSGPGNLDEEEPNCRICYGPGTPRNVLIVPCACRGSIEHVHADCLKIWLATTEAGGVSARRMCPLCRSAYQIRRGAPVASWRNFTRLGSAVAEFGHVLLGAYSTLFVIARDILHRPVIAAFVITGSLFFGYTAIPQARTKFLKIVDSLERSSNVLIYDRQRGEYC